MTRTVRFLFLLSAIALLAERPAAAQNLGGCTPGPVVDPFATFVVPAPAGAPVVIDFTACPGFPISTFDPGLVIACGPPKTVTAIAGPGGAVFSIGGCGGGLTPLASCATVTVGGVAAPPLRIGAFDRTCGGGVGAADFSLVINDFVNFPAQQRSDYDKSGAVGAGDLGIFISVFVGGGSVLTCPIICP